MEGLTIGRVVWYKPGEDADYVPGIVIKVWSKSTGCVNLRIFSDEEQAGLKTSVVYSEEPKPYTWKWPERA